MSIIERPQCKDKSIYDSNRFYLRSFTVNKVSISPQGNGQQINTFNRTLVDQYIVI